MNERLLCLRRKLPRGEGSPEVSEPLPSEGLMTVAAAATVEEYIDVTERLLCLRRKLPRGEDSESLGPWLARRASGEGWLGGASLHERLARVPRDSRDSEWRSGWRVERRFWRRLPMAESSGDE